MTDRERAGAGLKPREASRVDEPRSGRVWEGMAGMAR